VYGKSTRRAPGSKGRKRTRKFQTPYRFMAADKTRKGITKKSSELKEYARRGGRPSDWWKRGRVTR